MNDTPTPTEPKAAHTPIPWEVFPALVGSVACPVGTRIIKYGKLAIAEALFSYSDQGPTHAQAKANAEFIVRAVNSHDDLLNILKAIQQRTKCSSYQMGEDISRMVDSALAKATNQPKA